MATGHALCAHKPRQVRKFAEALGKLEKTDRIDAEVIARHAVALRVNPTRPKSDKQQHLDALSTRLRQVTSDLTVQKLRIQSMRAPGALESLGEVIALLKKQTKDLASRIAELVNDDPLWAALDQTFRQIKGVADRTVAVLLAELPEIGTLSNKVVAKLTGLAPIANDSGKRQGHRPIRGGRATVRNILFLVADIARKYDKSLAEFRQRLPDEAVRSPWPDRPAAQSPRQPSGSARSICPASICRSPCRPPTRSCESPLVSAIRTVSRLNSSVCFVVISSVSCCEHKSLR